MSSRRIDAHVSAGVRFAQAYAAEAKRLSEAGASRGEIARQRERMLLVQTRQLRSAPATEAQLCAFWYAAGAAAWRETDGQEMMFGQQIRRELARARDAAAA